MSMLGGFAGLQAGLWKLKSDYSKFDPEFKRIAEIKRVMAVLRDDKSAGPAACPRQQSKNPLVKEGEPVKEPKKNKYGDVVE